VSHYPAQDGVILIHGLARSPRSMDRMCRSVEFEGYATLNVDYPGHMDLAAIADLVSENAADWIAQITGDVHFVTHSMGGLIARVLIARHRPNRLGRVVMLAPPNQGSEIADLLSGTWPYQRLLGPAAMQLTTRETESLGMALGAIDFPLGIIAGSRSVDPVGYSVLPRPNDGKVTVERTKLAGMTDHIVLPATHMFMMRNPAVIAAAIRFLRDARFAEVGRSRRSLQEA
jgi:pimeloyl-ACP methyl ester carboxylesterase